MIVRQLFDKGSYSYTYLVVSDDKEALIIDPIKENIERDLSLIKELDCKLCYSIDTHTHADHITASGLLKRETKCKIIVSEYSRARGIDIRLKDNDILDLKGLKMKMIYTPGHTDDSCCYLINKFLFTGDTLLIRKTGRCDLQGGSAADQYNSIVNKLFTLPESTIIYPGHDYQGFTRSTIREEIRYNPRLQVKSLAEYELIMEELDLDLPRKIDIALHLNLSCGLN